MTSHFDDLGNDAFASNTAYAVNRNYTVNGLNQYTTAGTATFGYDANGNLTSDGTNAYVYDIENRLVTASGGHTATLRYDPLGRLYEVVGTSGTTRFLNDGDALVAEYNSAGTMTARYAHGSNAVADDPLIWYDGATPHWLHADHQGSIVGVTNGSGAMQSINAYDAWGIPNAANVGRFQYTGQAWLGELGMYYYKARIYSPTLGRFMQTDPIGYQDQINLYAYVGDDPVNRTDPTGTQSCHDPRVICPDIPLTNTPPQVRQSLAAQVPRPTRGVETGGQALRNNATGAITNRTGSAAGQGTADGFSHNPAPRGSTRIMLSHAHIRTVTGRTNDSVSVRHGNNAPGIDDQDAMNRARIPVQTIGPDVTTTMFRINRQDYLVVDSGDRSALPDLTGQHITVLDHDPQ